MVSVVICHWNRTPILPLVVVLTLYQNTSWPSRDAVIIVENLDVSMIFSHLNSQRLLTEMDCQILLNNHTTNTDKAQYLLDTLPRKEKFFDKFLHCLYHTTSGTGHRDIAIALSSSYTERNSQTTMLITLPITLPVYTSPNKEVRT